MVNKLVRYLKECDDAYYNTDNVLVNNDTYDALVETLRRLDPSHPYLNKVGAVVREGSKKLGRTVPMGTLSKYHTEEEIKSWLSKESDLVMLAPKYDGFGVELIYQDGSLVMASTRGSGYVGEDVLEAVMRIPNVPIHLPEGYQSLTRVRGEAIIPRVNHEKMKELGYSAMRNAVPGIVRSNRKDALGYVDFVAYEFFDGQENRVDQRIDYTEVFTVEDFEVFSPHQFDEILEARNGYGIIKDSYEYEIDGTVLKTVVVKEDDLLCPNHQIAWKFKSNRKTTTLKEVEFQMGVSGYFTPIGIFDEVEFQGASLKRASMGNITRMKKEFEGLTVGSIVEVSRRGDIIPYLESLEFINEEGDEISIGDRCPHCGSILEMDGEEPFCPEKSCPEKLRLQISQFARAIGVKGIGDKLVRGLIEAGYLKSIVDVYEIDPDLILGIPRQGKSAVEKWAVLQQKELSSLEVFSCYPFLDLGEKVWKLVLNRYTPMQVLNVTYAELYEANIKGLGTKKIQSIVDQVSRNREELLYLLNRHVK